jgi:hypothetical protein
METQRVEPTHCDTCPASLERGYSYVYEGEKLVRAICFDCDRKERNAAFLKTGVLTTKTMVEASLDRARPHAPSHAPPEAVAALDAIEAATKEFDRDVWYGGLREFLVASNDRGHSRHEGKFKILSYYMAGRYMFTLEDDEASLTLITTDDPGVRMGIQGVCATKGQALSLVGRALDLWRKHGSLEPDREVGLL